MKKSFCFFLSLLMVLSLAACGGGPATPTGEGEDIHTTPATNTPTDNPAQQHEYQPDPDLSGIVSINLPDVRYCVDAPGDLIKRSGTGRIIELNSYFVIYDQFVAGTSDKKYDAVLADVDGADEVLEILGKQFASNAEGGLIRASEYTCVIDSKENVTVNGWSMCKYKGKIQLTHKYELDYEEAGFVAYGLIKDGYPVYFAVVEKPDGKNPIDIEAMADKIARTFREYTEE